MHFKRDIYVVRYKESVGLHDTEFRVMPTRGEGQGVRTRKRHTRYLRAVGTILFLKLGWVCPVQFCVITIIFMNMYAYSVESTFNEGRKH